MKIASALQKRRKENNLFIYLCAHPSGLLKSIDIERVKAEDMEKLDWHAEESFYFFLRFIFIFMFVFPCCLFSDIHLGSTACAAYMCDCKKRLQISAIEHKIPPIRLRSEQTNDIQKTTTTT